MLSDDKLEEMREQFLIQEEDRLYRQQMKMINEYKALKEQYGNTTLKEEFSKFEENGFCEDSIEQEIEMWVDDYLEYGSLPTYEALLDSVERIFGLGKEFMLGHTPYKQDSIFGSFDYRAHLTKHLTDYFQKAVRRYVETLPSGDKFTYNSCDLWKNDSEQLIGLQMNDRCNKMIDYIKQDISNQIKEEHRDYFEHFDDDNNFFNEGVETSDDEAIAVSDKEAIISTNKRRKTLTDVLRMEVYQRIGKKAADEYDEEQE